MGGGLAERGGCGSWRCITTQLPPECRADSGGFQRKAICEGQTDVETAAPLNRSSSRSPSHC